jgi:putative selenate reductase
MSDRMNPLGIELLADWMFSEYESKGSIFSIPEHAFHRRNSFSNRLKIQVFGKTIETPFGPAAGPHTQLAQNIICAYLTGCRFIELKTVQKLDALEFEKPCIDAFDEGYNTEWSQELKLEESADQYISAWVLIHVLNEKLGLSPTEADSGCAFNMSVGYDLEGIKSSKMQRFISRMLSPEEEIAWRVELLRDRFPEISHVRVPDKMIHSATISTMHGCPPDEIEGMARYLIAEKGLHTYIKLNPTLLGKKDVRKILRHTGYGYVTIADETFEKDLQFTDAVTLVKNLKDFAKTEKKHFGVKLSNTLANKNISESLPGAERYMSGAPLFPITVHCALRLAGALEGKINISFCGGASSGNIKDILETGIHPVTLSTDALKPGGYLRFLHIAETLEEHPPALPPMDGGIRLASLEDLARRALDDPLYQKKHKKTSSIKLESKLQSLDCIVAPCIAACPIRQDIPEYIEHIQKGDYTGALRAVMKKNPLPNITGYICDQKCIDHCVRWDYDNPVHIRALKRIAAEKGNLRLLAEEMKTDIDKRTRAKSIAVIGSGPAGLASGFFLRREGYDVTVMEMKNSSGGTVRHAIPRFRLPDEVIARDVKFIESLGVRVRTAEKNEFSINELKAQGFDYIVIATGCGMVKELDIGIPEGTEGYYTGMGFLEMVKRKETPAVGSSVLVVGGGNSAVDAARTALRFSPKKVSLVYRRDLANMPADPEEITACIEEGVEILELLAPSELITENCRITGLRCQKMRLGEPDESGRKRPVPIDGEYLTLEADTLIAAIGEGVDTPVIMENGILVDTAGRIKVNEKSCETSVSGVFAAGDCVRGPATVVEAIADARKVCRGVIEKEGAALSKDLTARTYTEASSERRSQVMKKHGHIRHSSPVKTLPLDERRNFDTVIHTLSPNHARRESERCLVCSEVCNKCVETCPNRANIPIDFTPVELSVPDSLSHLAGQLLSSAPAIPRKTITFAQSVQILHIDDFCNECGNCETFCPHTGKPYTDKFTFFSSRAAFENSKNSGFHKKPAETDHTEHYRCRIERTEFDMLIDEKRGETVCTSDEFRFVFPSDNNGCAGKEMSLSGSGLPDLRQVLGLYHVIIHVKTHASYIFRHTR